MEIILKYFPNLTDQQIRQFSLLESLYKDWNSKINLISRKDLEGLYERHVLHSLAIAMVVQFRPKTCILDVGTGGGFPGIPLAILFPEAQFTLNDSIGKKIMVVSEISASLGLKNVTPVNARAEDLDMKFDFIVSRAVTDFPKFHSWVKSKIRKENRNKIVNGILYLKGGDLETELSAFKKHIQIFELKDFFTEEFYLTKKLVYYS
ncbi:MAG: 16S rRNA (guanine(527)-N(7))-methyltransferase RsmG [Bacteroidales bacterium]|nr:16S rRNA (guanine(527)-N(7))-methyltransferase RsmG [Bacteroidales bacterium]MCB9013167.1 16S rRNA (guanine(527)-N(7))-methyltransferase RsmG [Bacteroidales bacterium]